MDKNEKKILIALAVLTLVVVVIETAGGNGLKALNMESFEGRQDLPIGIRQNNPLNIRSTKTVWLGQKSNKGAFVEFYYLLYGVRAGIKNLRSIYNRGNFTVSKIINVWAPASDGNTPDVYAKIVASQMGIGVNEPFSFNEENVLPMVQAMCRVEQGKNYISESVFKMAWAIS